MIVGEYKGEVYPLAAFFGPQNGISDFVIQTFLQKTIDLGYKFQYITSEMDARNLTAISNCIGKMNIQICLWHLKRAIVGKSNIKRIKRPKRKNMNRLRNSVLGLTMNSSTTWIQLLWGMSILTKKLLQKRQPS